MKKAFDIVSYKIQFHTFGKWLEEKTIGMVQKVTKKREFDRTAVLKVC